MGFNGRVKLCLLRPIAEVDFYQWVCVMVPKGARVRVATLTTSKLTSCCVIVKGMILMRYLIDVLMQL